ncbi:MAG: Alanine--tRNA ligase [Clostridiales bacterium]|jgi:alanyl-tRNA synthetase|nr:Alanine--tRNA ligase [Clostridiales bacterium]
MLASELRRKYIEFFTERGHMEIASASLLPENDPSVLFTTAGMHPLVPYLLGEKHPLGKRLVNCQKCIRTDDIEEVGDASHLTYFEMLGNWSFGDYFKKESITMSFEFLTSVLNIPIKKLAITVFEGDVNVPRDEESYQIWRGLGVQEEQVYFYGRKENWWGPAGLTGPCGPDTEIFYDNGIEKCCETCGPACNCGKYVEIWNNVFMEYNKCEDGTYTILKQKNVDTGMGLDRILAIMNGVNTVFETDLIKPIIETIEVITGVKYTYETALEFRIISDHVRAITFILGDSRALVPSNSEQGYILRRLIRRTVRLLKQLNVVGNILSNIADTVIEINREIYPELLKNRNFILDQLDKEYKLFTKTLDSGLKQAEKYLSCLTDGNRLSGELAFKLYDTFGFPIELTQEVAKEKGFEVDIVRFEEKFVEHQEKSRIGGESKFKGGLSDNSEQTTKLHTATHLLNAALRQVLGDSVYQRGSNINAERLRFDFSFERKVTSEELSEVSKIVNKAIQQGIAVKCEEMSVEEAKAQGAIGVFDKKYSEIVKVYSIEGYSKEICGGPHANNTSELGSFTILKEESSSSGVRRIKAII